MLEGNAWLVPAARSRSWWWLLWFLYFAGHLLVCSAIHSEPQKLEHGFFDDLHGFLLFIREGTRIMTCTLLAFTLLEQLNLDSMPTR